mmetsp:Transcript_23624/g.20992  ORF Transcript_23624/g.20992 Transcript_23624/m.20992 type:complete len:84 (-) Transcript_23624:11-262(-)
MNKSMRSCNKVLNKIPTIIIGNELKPKLKLMRKNIIQRSISSDINTKMTNDWTTSNLTAMIKNSEMLRRKLTMRLRINNTTIK